MIEHFSPEVKRVVGTKQVLQALDQGRVAQAFIAKDADLILTKRVVDRCFDRDIPCRQVETMAELGKACGIDVGTAACAVLQ